MPVRPNGPGPCRFWRRMALAMQIFSAGPKEKPNDKSAFLRRVRPAIWRNPMPQDMYDLAIVGAGPAGIAAAESAARLGARVALVEKSRIGGNSLNAGTVPSKAIIKTANLYARTRNVEPSVDSIQRRQPLDFGKVMDRMRRIRTKISEHHSIDKLAALGIDLFFGAARFEGTHSITLGPTRLRFAKALVATGARSRPPDIPGLKQTGYRTSESVFEMSALPRRLAVIGGGPLGCEMAQAFCRLGSQVTIVQSDPKFLPREERDAAETLSWSMARDGVEIRLNTAVLGAYRSEGAKVLETVNNEVKSNITVDQILVSIGRVPNCERLDLRSAEIAFDKELGIRTDDFLRTTNPNVYAAGDVCLELKFTNAAEASARLAVHNALNGGQQRKSELIIPWCTYCYPEIAHIGMHVWQARRDGIPVKSFTVMMHDNDRAIADGVEEGFVKIHVAEGTDKILGATIVATRASELINEMSVIMRAGIGMTDLAGIVHTYPAESGAISEAALAFVRSQRAPSAAASSSTERLP
jgi:pyruvate/2-oxoglutarate dehydrogenase complex dihydrolipoamide dehydrogenase (E3) component